MGVGVMAGRVKGGGGRGSIVVALPIAVVPRLSAVCHVARVL